MIGQFGAGFYSFNQTIPTLGARIDDPTTFVQRLNSLLTALTDEDFAGSGEHAGAGQEEAG